MRTDIKSALPAAHVNIEQWLAMRPDVRDARQFNALELDVLFTQARSHGVLALLTHWPQTQTTLLSHPDHSKTVRAEYAKTALMDALHRNALVELSDIFAGSAIRGLVIKGTALAQSHYPSAGLRPRIDTDLFVDPKQIVQADQILRAAHWQPLPSNFSAVVLPERTYQKRFSGVVISLDVHWALSSRPCLARELPFESLYTNSVVFDDAGHWRMPCPVDALLIAAVHRIGHHRDHERFIWLYDVHLLWQSMAVMEQELTLCRAEQSGLCAILLDALEASQTLFHTEISSAELAKLQAVKDEPGAALLSGKLSVLAFDWRFASWHERFALIKQRVWAEPEYLRSRFNAKHAPIAWLQFRRWLGRR